MANALADLMVRLGLESAAYTNGLKKAGKDLEGFAGVAAQAAKRIEHLLEFEVAIHGAEQFYEFLKTSAEAADKMGKLAQSVGLPVETMQRFGAAAKMADLSQESLGGGLAKLSRNMAKADADSGDAARAFEALGIKTADSSGNLRNAGEVFLDIADKFAGMEDGAGKTAIAMMLFGRSGAELIPMLNLGRDGIAGFADGAQKAGKILSAEVIEKADEFNRTVKSLGGSLNALGAMVAAGVAQSFHALVTDLKDGSNAAENMRIAADGIIGGIKGVAAAAAAAIETFRPLLELIKAARAASEKDWDGFKLHAAAAIVASGDVVGAMTRAHAAAMSVFQPPGGGAAHGSEGAAKVPAPVIPKAPDLLKEAKGNPIQDEIDRLKAAQAKLSGSVADETLARMGQGKLAEALGKVDPETAAFATSTMLDLAGAIDRKKQADRDAEAAQRRHDEMMKEGARITEELLTPAEKYAATQAHLNELLAGGAITWETYGRALKKAEGDMRDAELSRNALANDLTRGMQSMFEDALSGGGRIDELFANLLKRLAAKAAAQEIMLQLGFKLPGTHFNEGAQGFGALSGLWGAITGGGGGSINYASYINPDVPFLEDMFAGGGNASAGKTYLVGEEGPELFTPSTSGRVIPNDQIGGGSTQHFNFYGTLIDRRAVEDFARQYSRDLRRGMGG